MPDAEGGRTMSIKDNFGNPRGFIGKMMLSGMNMGHTPMAKWGFTQFQVPNKGNILDIGCGGGFNIKRMIEKSKNGAVFGVDVSDTSVKKSKAVNKKYLGNRCYVYRASAENLPFDDNMMELVTAFETVYFWQNIEDCFLEIKRVLKQGGKFVIINDPGDPNKHWEKLIPNMTNWNAEQLNKLMEETGYTDIKISKNKFMFVVSGTK